MLYDVCIKESENLQTYIKTIYKQKRRLPTDAFELYTYKVSKKVNFVWIAGCMDFGYAGWSRAGKGGYICFAGLEGSKKFY